MILCPIMIIVMKDRIQELRKDLVIIMDLNGCGFMDIM